MRYERRRRFGTHPPAHLRGLVRQALPIRHPTQRRRESLGLPQAGRLRARSNTITITDRFGAQWCSANLGIHVGRRCFQKGLKQLEDLGAIVRRRGRGWRKITIIVRLAGPKPKPRTTAGKATPASAAAAAAPTAPAPAAPDGPPEPPPSPEECQQAAATLRALIAQAVDQDREQADGPAHQAETPQPSPAFPPRRPRLHVPDAIRREVEDKERRRIGDELARLRAIADDRRTDDQERASGASPPSSASPARSPLRPDRDDAPRPGPIRSVTTAPPARSTPSLPLPDRHSSARPPAQGAHPTPHRPPDSLFGSTSP